MSKSTQPAAAKPRKKPFFTNDDLWGYAFIGVAVIFFLMFTIYPLISAVITSLEDYKPFGSDFVGLKNYQTTFTNALFLEVPQKYAGLHRRGRAAFAADLLLGGHPYHAL